MIRPLGKQAFLLQGGIRFNPDNDGFDAGELESLADADAAQGAKGWERIWPRGRERPPIIGDLKSQFGYQTVPVLTDLVAIAAAQGVALQGRVKVDSAGHNFYIMSCGVYIAPEDGEQFEALKFEVRYLDKDISTHSMLPGPRSKTRFAVGAKAEVGVDARLEFGIPDLSIAGLQADATAKAGLNGKFIVSIEYEFKTPTIDAFGINNSFCTWLLRTGEGLRNDVLFYPVIMTPKELQSFACEFRASFKIRNAKWRSSELFIRDPIRVDVRI
jgi:hypothetical protein